MMEHVYEYSSGYISFFTWDFVVVLDACMSDACSWHPFFLPSSILFSVVRKLLDGDRG